MVELEQAAGCIGALHTRAARLLILVAQCLPLKDEDKNEVRYFPMIGRELLSAMEIEWRPSQAPPSATWEARSTVALCELHERTTRLILDCARHPLDQALHESSKMILEIYMWALEVVRALEIHDAA